ncbi:MAG TPA: heme-binding protein [Gemmatimonadaceae bacterium]
MRTQRARQLVIRPTVLLSALAIIAAVGCSDSVAPNNTTTSTRKLGAGLPTWQQLHDALVSARGENNGGLNLDMWGTIVDRTGTVVAVAFTGANVGDQWPASRAISAQKAVTANSLSLPGLALSTANLYSAVQPGGSLFGLQFSNPVDPAVVYGGKTSDYGTTKDFMVGRKPGGINVFGGGLALYASDGTIVGAIGVSGDLSCADHIIAWKARDKLGFDFVPAGVADGGVDDNIIYDITNGVSASGFGHPVCNDATKTIGQNLPNSNPIGKKG